VFFGFLDSAGSDHLLPQVVLVLGNGSIPSADGLVLAHHDVLGDLVKQSGGGGVSFSSVFRSGKRLFLSFLEGTDRGSRGWFKCEVTYLKS
jgi:hypothetical protein